jgi:hypothetical protein
VEKGEVKENPRGSKHRYHHTGDDAYAAARLVLSNDVRRSPALAGRCTFYNTRLQVNVASSDDGGEYRMLRVMSCGSASATCGSRSSRPVLRPQHQCGDWRSIFFLVIGLLYVFVLKSTRAWHLHSNAGSASGNLEGTSVEHTSLYERRNYSTTTRSQWKRKSSSPRNTVQWTTHNPKSSDYRAYI